MAKMVNCKSCGKEIDSNAKTCPGCGAKNQKPFYKAVWFWVIVIIVIICMGSGENGDSSNDDSQKYEKNKANKVTVVDLSAMTEAERDTWCSDNKINCVITNEYSDTIAKDGFISQSIDADKIIYEGDKITISISLGKKPTTGQKML